MKYRTTKTWRAATLAGLVAVAAAACTSPAGGPAPTTAIGSTAGTPSSTERAATQPSPAVSASTTPSVRARDLTAPDPIPFDDAVTRAGSALFASAQRQLGGEPRELVVDPLIDANTGAQTRSTDRMGTSLERIVKTRHAAWSVKPLTRKTLASQPLLLIGTLTAVNVNRSVDTAPDAFRVWLTLIDLRTGRVVAKQLDRATVGSVDAEPLKYYSDSPTWHKDRTVAGYINSCQLNTNPGDPADPDYLARLPAQAVVNEALLAYNSNQLPQARNLFREAEVLADPGDLRVLNGLYLTNWLLKDRDGARDAFGKLVASGLDLRRLPMKLLFEPGKSEFRKTGDLPDQYRMWIGSLAQQAASVSSCVRLVGHTSRSGSARVNERLSRQRAEAVQNMMEQTNRSLSAKLSAAGVGSREALVGIGTDDARDALDRRVEFRVVDCV